MVIAAPLARCSSGVFLPPAGHSAKYTQSLRTLVGGRSHSPAWTQEEVHHGHVRRSRASSPLGGDENSQEQQERAHRAASRWWKRNPEGVGPVVVTLVAERAGLLAEPTDGPQVPAAAREEPAASPGPSLMSASRPSHWCGLDISSICWISS